jgi:hypothetical protein
MQGLDLIAVQKKVRELKTARQLFQMWNAVCRLHDRGSINSHELDEIQIVICSQFKQIERADQQQLSKAA